ncbi:MAG: twin-arginine translocation signal domain-containing protein, partial [Flavobacteriaceae bacterium]
MSINRRNFLKKTSLSTAALASVPLLTNCQSEVKSQAPSGGLYMGDHAAPKLSKIRAAFIGVGSR